MNGGPAIPVWVVPDADLKKNGGTWAISGQAAVPITGTLSGGDIGDLTATGYAAGQSPRWDGADFVPADYYTEAEADALYGQLGAANTWAQAQTFTGQVLASAGTVGAPGLSFSGDPNTGLVGSGDNLQLVAGGTARVLISTSTAQMLLPFWTTITDTAVGSVTQVGQYRHNTSNTPGANFGLAVDWQLQSSTTTNQVAAKERVYWSDATHAIRTSRFAIQTVYNAGSLTDTIAAGRTGAADSTGLWLYDESAGSLKQVTRGAADSGGAGFRLLRIAN